MSALAQAGTLIATLLVPSKPRRCPQQGLGLPTSTTAIALPGCAVVPHAKHTV
jgi:hypothetical protein